MLLNKEPFYYVNPNRINYIGQKNICPKPSTIVLDGDWDIRRVGFEEGTEFMRCFKQILAGMPWEETDYYKTTMKKLSEGHKSWRAGCKNERDLKKRCKKLEGIFEDIRDNGWRQDSNSDFVTISIDRHGRYLFNDGQHRLGMAKILNLQSIPVKIAIRHSEWIPKRDRVLEYARKQGKLYAPIDHIEFSHLPTANPGRAEYIADTIFIDGSTILDIGAHWGYLSDYLCRRGHVCDAIELDKNYCKYMSILKIANESTFNAINCDIFNYCSTPRKYDVVLALNIFHHFLKTKKGVEKLIKLLKSLDMNQMFLEAHSPTEKPMLSAFMNLCPDDFAKFIINNSCLTQYTVGKTLEYNSRVLFHIFK